MCRALCRRRRCLRGRSGRKGDADRSRTRRRRFLSEACDAAFRAAVRQCAETRRQRAARRAPRDARPRPRRDRRPRRAARCAPAVAAESLKARIVAPASSRSSAPRLRSVNAADRPADLHLIRSGSSSTTCRSRTSAACCRSRRSPPLQDRGARALEQGKRGVSFRVRPVTTTTLSARIAAPSKRVAGVHDDRFLRSASRRRSRRSKAPPRRSSRASTRSSRRCRRSSATTWSRSTSRIDRAITFVESWWKAFPASLPSARACRPRASRTSARASSSTMTRMKERLLRFALEARAARGGVPEAADQVTPLRARIDALEEGSSKALAAMRLGRADAAWSELLGPLST